MMEQRRALTIPFTVDKDNLMDPLRIPISCLSSNCEEVERQVSWTAFAARKLRHCDSQHKNGSILFDHNHTAIVSLEMARRKPRLILTDVLKTEPGKAYMDRIKQSHTSENGGRVSGTRREGGRCRAGPLICRNRRSSQREDSCDSKQSVNPKCNEKNASAPLQRSRLRIRLQNEEDEADKEENKDIEEVIIGNDRDEDDRFAEVVDCGLSVSWEPSEDTGGVHSLKRKRKNDDIRCNGSDGPRCHRESVLRLSGEDGRDGGPAATRICLEQSGESVDLDSLDPSIVEFTVGADDDTEVLVPNISLNLKAGDSLASPRRRLSSDQESTSKAGPAEPIVLSSDEEESCGDPQPCSPAVSTHFTVEDTAVSPVKDIQPEASEVQGLQVLHVLLDDPPRLEPESLSPTADYACMGVAFSTLHCGGYGGIANGNIMIADQKLIIPLKDTSEQMELLLTFERKELRKYCIWEQQDLEDRELQFKCNEDPCPPAFLLLCVSETAAAAVHQDLLKLCAKQDETRNSGEASPFILLTLRDVLEGMEGALLRSVLDIDCLSSLHEKFIIPNDADRLNGLENLKSPVLSLDDCIELISSSGLDSHLLSLLGLERTDPSISTEQHSPQSDRDTNTTSLTLLEVNTQTQSVLEMKTATEQDAETQPEPEEDQTKQELKPPDPSEEPKDKSTPVYTLCHRRTRGSYGVSMCKPDPSWTKYKHRGAARRLIQFPPPPLKGGITVTMEDLQCLDNGQFLNDVIIDFYLKYLLQNAPAAVAARSHIFSSFFYKQLTRRDNASEGITNESCQRQRRHQRVKTWTRHVDIFKKDFLFVPVNQEAHWYVVVICFPGLDEPKYEAWNDPNPETGKSNEGTDEGTETPATVNHSDNKDTDTENTPEESAKDPPPGPVNCTEQTCQKKTVCKRPCILIMDSLKLSLHERVFKLLRDYLQSEWEVRRGSSRDFGPDQMQSSHCLVPLQDNSSDCGLYLLQYVESFLKDPVVHFDLPLRLKQWFPRQQVRRKRDEIRNLILNLYRHQNLDSSR